MTEILFPEVPLEFWKLNDFGDVLVKVGRGEPERVPVREFPLKSNTLVPVPEYDDEDSGSRFKARVPETIDGADPPKVYPVRVGVGRVIAVPPVIKVALGVEFPPSAPL